VEEWSLKARYISRGWKSRADFPNPYAACGLVYVLGEGVARVGAGSTNLKFSPASPILVARTSLTPIVGRKDGRRRGWREGGRDVKTRKRRFGVEYIITFFFGAEPISEMKKRGLVGSHGNEFTERRLKRARFRARFRAR